ncbi:glycosyltransferase family 2 protein [Nonomuraea sp. PA05]|uniref:glycosyltransferase family 2 protein n=1 Tax=Nonomuraea sp. PA05 TaxID=2604466 RepID=UPI0021CC78AA|nr:glycosyltransferase family 2 protein [Nonomuraea sp. PA05]
MDYVLPLRWADDRGLGELTAYLRALSRHVRIIVVDGSPPELFERHAAAWHGLAAHVRPAPDLRFANGKVNGVITGMRLATAEHVVIADDDVRYDGPALARMAALLARAELVRPQNHFTRAEPARPRNRFTRAEPARPRNHFTRAEPARPRNRFARLPWHARWDTARTLLNRGLGADYPGTLGVRRSFFLRMGGYNGDVLFENLELIRTVRAHGGRELRPLDLYVPRLPPEAARFWSQRVRQAYDDLAQPARLALFLSVLPGLAWCVLRRRYGPVAAGAGAAVALAELGRRRAGGGRVFPRTASLFAPVWVLERAVCGWLAVGAAACGGVPYAGRRLRRAAHSVRWLRRSAHSARRSGSLDARNPAALCEPSQNGFAAESPQRHSATVARPAGIGTPS